MRLLERRIEVVIGEQNDYQTGRRLRKVMTTELRMPHLSSKEGPMSG